MSKTPARAKAQPVEPVAKPVAEPVTDLPAPDIPANAGVMPLPSEHIAVRCTRKRGIWRAGRFWPPEPVAVALADLSDEQFEQINGEPLLVISPLE